MLNAIQHDVITPPHPRCSMTCVCWVQYNMTLAYHDVITPPHPRRSMTCVCSVQYYLTLAYHDVITPPHPRRSMTYVCWVQYNNMTLAYHDVITPPLPTPHYPWRKVNWAEWVYASVYHSHHFCFTWSCNTCCCFHMFARHSPNVHLRNLHPKRVPCHGSCPSSKRRVAVQSLWS